jgi:glucose-1-phosphate thymidylyltransferase
MVQCFPNKKCQYEVVGLIPAGGKATRVAPLPCSKELYPIGFSLSDKDGSLRPKVACHYLLEKMQFAGISKAFIVLRNGKWDIPAYFEDGNILKMHLSYLMMRLPFGTPYTLNQAYPFVKDAVVALGFPDIIFQPDDAFVHLLERLSESDADMVLGLFNTHQPQKWDMIDLDDEGRIRSIVIKPILTDLSYSWAIAVWKPVFTYFMHEYLSDARGKKKQENNVCGDPGQRELFVGDVIQAAIDEGLKAVGVLFPDHLCLDIGTPDDLVKAVQIMK